MQEKARTTVTEDTVLKCIEEALAENRMVAFSDFQHKGNIGEGQFHINSLTLPIHLDHYGYKTLTYDELYKLLAGT